MRDEEVTFTITQKLRLLTFLQNKLELFLNRVLECQQSLHHEPDGFIRRPNTKGATHGLLYTTRHCAAINSRSTTCCRFHFSNYRVNQRWFEKLRDTKQIGPGVRHPKPQTESVPVPAREP